jgi:hypothetical protein
MRATLQRVLVSCLLVLGVSAFALAQGAPRTWVSGVGDDLNPCSRTAPCKTFAGAIPQTAAGGIITVLDPGGFGSVTITKSLTIVSDIDLGSILDSGVNGIVVNTLSTDTVMLQGLAIQGAGSGSNGIRFVGAGTLIVENCVIEAQNAVDPNGHGIDFAPNASASLQVLHTTIRDNSGHGIYIHPSGGTVNATISDSHVLNNGRTGVRVEAGGNVTVRDTVASGNKNGLLGMGLLAPLNMTIDGCSFSESVLVGVTAGGGTTLATVRLNNSTVTNNLQGLSVLSNGSIVSWQNNHVAGNGTNGAPSTTVSPM